MGSTPFYFRKHAKLPLLKGQLNYFQRNQERLESFFYQSYDFPVPNFSRNALIVYDENGLCCVSQHGKKEALTTVASRPCLILPQSMLNISVMCII